MTEIWKPIVGYEGQYEISSMGRVRSFVARRHGMILKQCIRKDGYLQVQLKVNQKPRNMLVHVLMSQAFHAYEHGDGLVVNHLDGNKGNNTLENLERVTRSENSRHAWRTGLAHPMHGKNNPASTVSEEAVIALLADYQKLIDNGARVYGMWSFLSALHGIPRSTVFGICRGISRGNG